MQLHHVVQALPQRLGGVHLGDGGLLHAELAAQVFAQVVVDQRAHGHRLRLDVGQLELRVLEVPHGLVEGAAVLHVLEREAEQALQRNSGIQGDDQALLRQLLHEVGEALVLFAQAIGHGHAHVVEEQFGGVGRGLAHLVELAAAAKACAVGLDHDQAHALGAGGRIGLAHQQHHVAAQAVADEDLAAVDDVVVAVAHGGGADRLHVGAAARLGDAHRQDLLAAADAGQPLLLLRFGAQAHDVRRNDVGVQREPRARHTRTVHLFEHDRRMAEIAATAAVLGRHRHAQQAFAAGLEPGLAVDPAGLVPRRLTRHALAFKEALCAGPEHFVVFAKDRAIHIHWELLSMRLLMELRRWGNRSPWGS
ncbi:hypothetical protein D3C85_835640 [compost metagenome]